ncbi:hypothetical protein HNQ50_000366 [Silvimonas terrae]|uniref:Uncharacterized protein n=1 Tax=Silvimonas terrae TaxID=300266 RepID=A0A840RB25_9NEIS|nr:hypothetical protein [Silvimonas terrae]MBB5189656.1 hypothetical protein [Silvimonas terrae]
MKSVLACLPMLLLSVLCHAADSDAPVIRAGDSWRYQDVAESTAGTTQGIRQITVTRVADGHIEYTLQQGGTPQSRTVQTDWSRVHTFNGQDRVIDRPFLFPLENGKTWELHSAGPVSDSGKVTEVRDEQYAVNGVEMVNVAAGRFKTIRVEAQAQWTTEPGHIRSHSTRTLWYAPDAKRWVKAEETVYDANGMQRQHVTEELQSLQLAP